MPPKKEVVVVDKRDKRPILIAAGGTGGHVFPALAIANELLRAGAQVLWLGVGGIEKQIVQSQGLTLFIIPFRSPSRFWHWFYLPLAVSRALYRLWKIRPSVVLGMGGYAAVPGGLAAFLLRIPLLIHEQNAIAGRANRLLHRFAKRTLTGFPEALPGGHWIGNPVRQSFTDEGSATVSTDGALRILVLGGSQGARALNQTVPAGVGLLAAQGQPFELIHQCGKGNADVVKAAYQHYDVDGSVYEFIDNVASIMRQVDLVICRAGASTLAELAMSGVASVLVPYPYAAANHQQANARFFAVRQAATLCPEQQFNPQWLADFLHRMSRADLATMATACLQLAKPNAASIAADYCLQEGHRAT